MAVVLLQQGQGAFGSRAPVSHFFVPMVLPLIRFSLPGLMVAARVPFPQALVVV